MDWVTVVNMSGLVLVAISLIYILNGPTQLGTVVCLLIGIWLFTSGREEEHEGNVGSSGNHEEYEKTSQEDTPKKYDFSLRHHSNPYGVSNKMNPKILGAQFDKQGRLMGCVHAVEGVRECPGCYYYGSCCYTDKYSYMYCDDSD